MRCLVVIAHPLADSLSATLAKTVVDTLAAAGHEVVVEDLYATGFAPALTPAERRSYYQPVFDDAAVAEQIGRLKSAEALVLVFPTWCFGFPAMLKGWFDRVWAPGIAYDHAQDLGAITPRLHNLHRALALTSLGAPWWVDCLVMWQPVKRMLKIALLHTCAPHCRFEMLSLYQAEKLSADQVSRFEDRVRRTLRGWR